MNLYNDIAFITNEVDRYVSRSGEVPTVSQALQHASRLVEGIVEMTLERVVHDDIDTNEELNDYNDAFTRFSKERNVLGYDITMILLLFEIGLVKKFVPIVYVDDNDDVTAEKGRPIVRIAPVWSDDECQAEAPPNTLGI